MSEYFDRDGKPIPQLLMWAKKMEYPAYQRVAETTLPDGKWISTVWLGIDHRFRSDGPPIIFETMVFSSKSDMGDLDSDRYSTESEAVAGHAAMVEKWSKVPA